MNEAILEQARATVAKEIEVIKEVHEGLEIGLEIQEEIENATDEVYKIAWEEALDDFKKAYGTKWEEALDKYRNEYGI